MDSARPTIYALDSDDPNASSGNEQEAARRGIAPSPAVDAIVEYKHGVAELLTEYFSSADINEARSRRGCRRRRRRRRSPSRR